MFGQCKHLLPKVPAMKLTEIAKRPVTGLILLASAAGGPYVLYETDAGKAARNTLGGAVGASSTPNGLGASPTAWGNSPSDSLATSHLNNALNATSQASRGEFHLIPAPVTQLSEVLRFDITPGWVLQRFPRVSTVLAELQLDGLRVPLVTGSTPSDLAGTLTYYFDRYQRLQRVKLHGVTGDPNRCVAELQRYYKFQQEPALGGGLYMLKWNGQPASVLHLAPAPVIYADAPYSRFNVFLELNQAGLAYGLSDEAQQLVRQGRMADRW
jgi:hypothetical protein